MTDDSILQSNILIIDDDDDLRETLTDVLSFEGFVNIYQAEDGFKALEVAKKQSIDLILSDLQMPEMDGIETIKRIKEYQPDVVSMIITGFGSMELAIKAFSESRVEDFLSKPIENDELIDKIKSHLVKLSQRSMESSDMVRKDFGFQSNLLGQYLLDNEFISEEDLIEALSEQKASGKMLGLTLVDMGIITEDELVSAIADIKGYVVAQKKDFSSVSDEALALVPENVAKDHGLLPLNIENDDTTLRVVMVNPGDLQVTDTLRMITKKEIEPLISTREKIEKAIDEYYSKLSTQTKASSALSEIFGEEDDINLEELAETVEDEEDPDSAPVVKLVSSIMQKAVLDGTSDIHIEPEEDHMKIRFRKDGNLYFPQSYERLPKKLHNPVVARIKVLTNSMKLDIKKRPQDGKIRMIMNKRKIDFRVASLPTIWGEKVVMRILDSSQNDRTIEEIFTNYEPYVNMFTRNIQRKDGMVLVTGPTGSGKTQTLAAAINHIKDIRVNIITVEDPVEITNPGVIQVQIDNKQGLTFASVLRQVLRQDPDIVMVGEMRDYETAHIGAEAALTGHLVFSTLHTNDAPSTITRFVEMGLKSYLVGTVVNLILAQRLGRRICNVCKVEHEPTDLELKGIGIDPESVKGHKFYKGEGCANCRGTGQKGRVAIVEMLELTPAVREVVMRDGTAQDIAEIAKKEDVYYTLQEDALRKFKDGIIDLKEVNKYVYIEGQHE